MKRVIMCVGVVGLATSLFGSVAALPAGHEQLEWIETTTYTYIKTEYTPKSSDRIYAKVRAPTSSGQSYAIFCARGPTDAMTPYTALSVSGKFRFDYGTTGTAQGWSYTPNADYAITINDPAGEVWINGAKQGDLPTSGAFTAGGEMTLFIWHNNMDLWGGRIAGQRMYAFSVTNAQGVAEVDFVPCRKHNENGTMSVGLYDRVRRSFHGNAAPIEAFRAGPTVVPTGLPAGYVKADYIQSIDAMCIQTDYRPHCKDRLELKYHLTGPVDMGLISARASGTPTVQNFTALIVGGQYRFDYNNKGTALASPAPATDAVQELVFDGLNRRVTLDGGKICDLVGGAADDWTAAAPLCLFAWQGGVNADYGGFARMRVYAFRVVDKDGAERMRLQPCINAATLRPGLYDLVSNRFYDNGNAVNAQVPFDVCRTGYRRLLPSDYKYVDNIEATGAQYLMTTNFVHCADRLEMSMRFNMSGSGTMATMFCARGPTTDALPYFSGLVILGKYRFDYVTSGTDTQKNANTAFVANNDIHFVMDGKNKSVMVNASPVCGLGPNAKFATYDKDYGDDWTTSGTLSFLAWHNAGASVGGYVKAWFYTARLIGQDGAVKLQLVPCYEKRTGLAGTYDLAGKRFYSSAGSQPFMCERRGMMFLMQ